MKRSLMFLAAFVMPVLLFAADKKPVLSTTMDFLDIAMIAKESKTLGYYPLEAYEKEIKKLADAGVKKFYLRVNCCGLTFFDSKVRLKYKRENGGHFHWIPKDSAIVEKTCEMYDPLAETIRLCRKYGMEVWAWENMYDHTGTLVHSTRKDIIGMYGPYPMCDKIFRDHPEYLAMHRPDANHPTPEQAKKVNAEMKSKTIGKIVLVSDRDRDLPLRINQDNIQLYVSSDNFNWEVYNGPKTVSVSRQGKRNVLTVSGLNIPGRQFVKILPAKSLPADVNYGFVIIGCERNAVYDTDGNKLPVQWGSTFATGAPDGVTNALNLDFKIGAHAWDRGMCGFGFGLGWPSPWGPSYYRGIAELHEPEVMKHYLAAFAELAAYDFDGYYFSSRVHSFYRGFDVDEYGFNPVVREKYLARFGVDIWDPEFKDTANLQKFRAEAWDEYLAGCKKLVGDRPIYVCVPNYNRNAMKHKGLSSCNTLGSFTYNWQKWIKEGYVDGLVMIGWCEPEYFAEAKAKYGTKISVFSKIKSHLKLSEKDFAAHLKDLRSIEGLDEIEMYETCLLVWSEPHLRAIRNAVDDASAVAGGSKGALERVQKRVKSIFWD